LQVLIVVAFGAFCFGCGYLTAFILTRNSWRDETIKRGIAHYNWTTGKWEWGEPPRAGPPAANDPPAGSPESMRAMLAKRRE
jgi:hypothetical protein